MTSDHGTGTPYDVAGLPKAACSNTNLGDGSKPIRNTLKDPFLLEHQPPPAMPFFRVPPWHCHSSLPRWALPPGFEHLVLQLLALGQQVLGTLGEALSSFQHVLGRGEPRDAVGQPWSTSHKHDITGLYPSSVQNQHLQKLHSIHSMISYNGCSTFQGIRSS